MGRYGGRRVQELAADAGPNCELCIQSEKGVPPMVRLSPLELHTIIELGPF